MTMNPDGSFTYDPTGSAMLQAIPRGQTATDTFTYRANDGHGGTAIGTVTITVTGVINHPPVANPTATRREQRGFDRERRGRRARERHRPRRRHADGRSAQRDRRTAPFTGTSTDGAAVTINADGSFSYDPTGSAMLQAIPRGRPPPTRSPTR